MRRKNQALRIAGNGVQGDVLLLVEDNPADVLLLMTALSEIGLSPELQVVTDGEQAIKYIEGIDRDDKDCPDMFVLDLNLPKRNGLEVLRSIRASKNCRKTPVVMLSSEDSSRDRAEAKRLGATTYIKKALSVDGLLEIGSKLQVLLHPELCGEAPNPI
jgi:DNA-binding response OmpR family regulator